MEKDSKSIIIPDSGKWFTPFVDLHFWNYLENKFQHGECLDFWLECYKDYIETLGYRPGIDFIHEQTKIQDIKLLKIVYEQFCFLNLKPKFQG